MEVVRSQAVARALREEGSQGNQKQPLSIARGLQKYRPPMFGIQLLEADCFLNLVELGLDEVVS